MQRNHRLLPSKRLTFHVLRLTFCFFLLFSHLLPHIDGHAYAQEPSLIDSSLLEQGKELLKKGDYNGALTLLTEAASKEPENAAVYNYLGEAYYRLKRYGEAVDTLKKAITLSPDYITPHAGLGIVYDAMGNSDEARKEFEEVLRIGDATPDVPEVRLARERLKRISVREHLGKGRVFFDNGEFEKAIEEINMVISIDPDNITALMSAGLVYKELNRKKDSYDAFKKVTGVQPGNIIAHFNMGEIHFSVGAFQEAITEFQEVIRIAPDSGEAKEAELRIKQGEEGLAVRKYFEEASAFVKVEKYDVAEETFKKILELQPKNSFALYNMGVVYFKTSRLEDALGVLLKSAEINPEDVQTHYLLGSVYDKLGRYDEAIAEFDKVAESKVEIEEVTKARERVIKLRRYVTVKKGIERIDLLIEEGDIENALREVEILLVEDDKNERAHLLLGRIQLKKGDIAKAYDSVKRAIGIKPEFWDAYILLGQVNEAQHKYSEAADAYRAVMSGAPRTKQGVLAAELLKSITTKLHFERARGYMDKGDLDGALNEIISILEITPEDQVALYNAGVIYYRLNMPREAESHLKRAVEKNPEYVQAYLQLGLVYENVQRFDEAELQFRRVLSITDTGREADIAKARLGLISEEAAFLIHMKEANRLLKIKDYAGAKKELEAVIAITPENYMAYFQLGIVYDEMGRDEDAIKTLKLAVEVKPDYAPAHLLMGRLYELDGRVKEAKGAYRKASVFGEGTREGDMADTILKKFRNWRLSGSIGNTLDSNISYGAKRRTGLSTGHSLRFSYSLYTTEAKKLTVDVSVSRGFNYQQSQLAGITYDADINWSHSIRTMQSYGINAGYVLSTFEGQSNYRTLSYSVSTSISTGAIPSSLSMSHGFSTTKSFVSPTSNAVSYSVSFSASQTLSIRDSVSGGYSFSAQVYESPLSSNYAARSNSLSLSYSRTLTPNLSVSSSYGLTFTAYSNPDSTTLFTRFRRNVSESWSVSLSYRLSEKVSFSLSASKSQAKTNLAAPTSEELRTLEEILSAPLPMVGGGYKKETVTMGIGVAF